MTSEPRLTVLMSSLIARLDLTGANTQKKNALTKSHQRNAAGHAKPKKLRKPPNDLQYVQLSAAFS